jgi:hypothetical protein
MDAIGRSATEGQKAMQNLYASVESSMALATHAEGWSWKQKQTILSGTDELEMDGESNGKRPGN